MAKNTAITKLSADLVANTAGFETGLDRAGRKTSQFQKALGKNLKQVDQSFAGLASSGLAIATSGLAGLAAGALAAASGVGMGALIKSSVDAASALNDTSQRLQVTTDDLQKFQYAFGLSGVNAEQLETILTKLNAKIADGTYKYKDATEGIYSIADAVNAAKTGQEKLAIVNEAFGAKLGSKTIPALNGGAEGLKALGDEATRTGNVLNSDTIKAADDFGDSLDILLGTLQKNFQQGFLEKFVGQTGDLSDLYKDPAFGEAIRETANNIGSLASAFISAASALGGLIAKFHEFDKAKQTFADGLDEKFFAWGKTLDTRGNRVANTKQSFNGMFAGAGLAIGVPPAAVESPVTPYRPGAKMKAAADAMKSQKKSIDDLLGSLKLENEMLSIKTQNYGLSAGAIARATKEAEINNAVAKAGITLSAKQKDQIKAGLDMLEQLTNAQEEQAKATKKQEEADQARANAFEQLGATFSSAFEDAALAGGDLGDVLNSLAQDILKLAFRTQILQPLVRGLFGEGGSGGGGLLSSIGGIFMNAFTPSVGSHATGLDYVSRDTVARVHKGEGIMNARDMRNLGKGRGDLNVNIVNRVPKAEASARRNEGDDLEILFDQASAKNVARRGSRTDQALNARASRSLTRRG